MKESIKELTKKTIIVMVVSLILLASVIPPKAVYAIDSKTAGETIAQFAINFYTDYKDEVDYDTNSDNRRMMYNGEKCSDGKYHCDCAGWINFVLHQSLALEMGTYDDGGDCSFVEPKGDDQDYGVREAVELIYGGYDQGKKSAEDIIAHAEPGDIILAWNHVMLYIGNGEVIHCAGSLLREQLSNTANNYEDKLYGIVRITDAAAAGINENDCTTIFGMKTGAGELDDYGLYWGTTTGRYTGSYTLGDWLFSLLGQFLDYLLGIITYIIKIPFLGYTNIVEAVVNDFLQQLSGDDMRAVTHEEDEVPESDSAAASSGINGTRVVLNDEEKLYKPTAKIETWDRVTIEDIIFDRIPVLDVDVFSKDRAAGQAISEDSIIYKIRTNIATWYYIIRNVAIVIMLLVLIFLGIQLAITTSAGKKANYKGMLISWLSGFVVIFVIHYYMILVITLNQEMVKIFENVCFEEEIDDIETDDLDEAEKEQAKTIAKQGRSQSLYDTIRTRAYSFKLTEGFSGTIIYMVLVYYMIKYLYIYFKRYLTVNILILIAPAIGVKYAYDRIKSGKGGGVTSWMFDFFVNVFLQSIHALIYTIFISIVIDLAFNSLAGFVLALFTLNFMQKAEKTFIKIFNFEGKGSSLADTRTNDFRSKIKNAAIFTMFAVKAPKALWGGTKFVGKAFGSGIENQIINPIGFIAHGVNNLITDDDSEYKEFRFKNQLEKIKKVGGKVGEKAGDYINEKVFKGNNIRLSMHKYKESDPKLYKAMKETLENAKKQRKAQRSRMWKAGAGALTGAARVMVGIPMFIADGEAGALMLVTGVSALRNASKEEKKYGYRSTLDSDGNPIDYEKRLQEDEKRLEKINKIEDEEERKKAKEKAIKKLKKKEKRRRNSIKRAQIELNASTMGFYGTISGEAGKFGKDRIKNKETLEKLTALSQMASKEKDIDKIMEEINKLEEELEREMLADKHDEEEKEKAREKAEKERKRRLQDTAKGADKEIVKASVIAKVVEDYLFENDLTKVTDADIDSIMKRIAELEGSSGAKVEFESGFKNNVRKALQEKINSKHGSAKAKRSLDKKDVVDIFENAIVAEGSVKPHDDRTEVEKIAEEYVHENNLTKVKESDVNSIIKRIADSQGADVTKAEGFKDSLIKTVKKQIRRKAEEDKKSDKVKEIEAKLSDRYGELKQNVKEMHAITERAKVRTGSSVTNATSYVKRTNTRQLAEKIKNSRKGGK